MTSNYNRSEIYSFFDLSKEGKEQAIDNLRDINVDYSWWDFTYEETYSFFDLSEEQQNEALNNSNDQEHAEERSYIIYNHIQGDEVLPLDMFMRLEHSKLFDGVYGQTAFSAYFVKFNKSNDEALVAYRYN